MVNPKYSPCGMPGGIATQGGIVGSKSKGRFKNTKERVRPYAESAGHVGSASLEASVKASRKAKDKVGPYAEKAVERGAVAASHAVDKVGPAVDEALHKLGPAAADAAEKARERLNDDVLPKISGALTAIAAAAEPAIEETGRRGKATKAALKGEVDAPKPRHRVRKLLVVLGFGAVAAAVAKKLMSSPEPAWQSTPTAGANYGSSSTSPSTSRPRPAETTKPESKPAESKTAGPKPGSETLKEAAADGSLDATTAAPPEAASTNKGKNGTQPTLEEEAGTTPAAKTATSSTRRRTTSNSKPGA